MNPEDLKSWIQQNCITIKGNFNNRCAIPNQTWWVNKGFQQILQEIINITPFIKDVNITQRCWHITNDLWELPLCIQCKKNVPVFRNYKDGYRSLCSLQCTWASEERNNKIAANINYTKKIITQEKNNLKKYGVVSTLLLPEQQQKMRNKKIAIWGSLNANNKKRQQTNLERYGNKEYRKSQVWFKKRDELLKENKGSLKLSPEINQKLNDINYLIELNETKSITEISEIVGVTSPAISLQFKKHNVKYSYFTPRNLLMQNKVVDYCKSIYNGSIIECNREILSPKELDIYFPDKQLAIELNGVYWHSYNEKETQAQVNKHQLKYQLCCEKGIKLLQFTDIDWLKAPNICKGIIKNSLNLNNNKIRASKCCIYIPKKEEIQTFYNENHIQGFLQYNHTLALRYNDEIVSMMTISKSRFTNKYDYELLRFVSKIDYTVFGAASKLLKQFNIQGTLVSYQNLDYFSGNLYKNLGFHLSHTTLPDYFYSKGNDVVSRYESQKHKLPKLLNNNFNPQLTESENMFSNGYRRYWGCGNNVWILNRKN